MSKDSKKKELFDTFLKAILKVKPKPKKKKDKKTK